MSFDALAKAPPADLAPQIKNSWDEFNKNRSSAAKGKKAPEPAGDPKPETAPSATDAQNAGQSFKRFSEEIGAGGSSKVALARNYADLSQEGNANEMLDSKKTKQGVSLLEPIIKALKLPGTKAKTEIEEK
jgi:hypothetical protein